MAAYNSAGTSSRASTSVSTSPCLPVAPAAPAGLSVSGVSTSALTLSWSAASRASGYRVFLNGSQVSTTSATSYTFSGLACGTSYTLGVEAYNSAGTSSRSSISGSTGACPVGPPAAPSGLSVSGVSTSALTLSWSAVSRASGYRVFLNVSQVSTSSATSYTFSGLACGTSYTLGVEAYNTAGASARSPTTSRTSDCPPPTYTEVAGPNGAGTFTNYQNAGGTLGSRIAPYQRIQVACKLQGFRVANGNPWWYRIASSPWNGQFYASADNFYNNGQTSGSLRGTPFVDSNVRDC
ncbi:MAG: fibronectin type III domain-containing protein [Gaiellaceae bacterium]